MPGAAGQRVRGDSLASQTGWRQPVKGRTRYPSIALCRAHQGGHGIGVDDILDGAAPVPFEAGRCHVSSIGMGGHQASSP